MNWVCGFYDRQRHGCGGCGGEALGMVGICKGWFYEGGFWDGGALAMVGFSAGEQEFGTSLAMSAAGVGVVTADRKICKFTFGRRDGAGAGVWEKRVEVGRISKVMRPKWGLGVGVDVEIGGIRRAWVGRITRARVRSAKKCLFRGRVVSKRRKLFWQF